MSEITRYKEGYDPNHAQECLCNRRPMSTGLVVDKDGDYVDYEDYQKLEQEVKELKALQERYVWITRDELEQYSDVNQALMGQSLAQHDKETRKEFLDFVKQSENLTGIEKLTVHALWVKFEQLQEQE